VVNASGDAGDWVRERDDELPVDQWDEGTGEMTRLPRKRPSARAQAGAMVAAALRRDPSSTSGVSSAG
jgi:hypothetical protein